MSRQCSTVTVADDGSRSPCLEAAIEDSDFCAGCAETAVQEGETDSLRCPWCDEYGDFTHLAAEPASELVDHAGPPGREVECGSCHNKSYVLEARLWLRVQRVLLPEEIEEAMR